MTINASHASWMFDTIRRYARPTKPDDSDKLPNLHQLEKRLLDAIGRDSTATTAVDGYPSGTIGNSIHGSVELTSVEGATETLVFGHGAEDDLVHDHVEQAYGYLQDAANAIGALHSRLDLIDRVQSPRSRSETGGAGACLCCGELVTGAAGDRLRRGLRPACYTAWIRQGRPDLAEFKRSRQSDNP